MPFVAPEGRISEMPVMWHGHPAHVWRFVRITGGDARATFGHARHPPTIGRCDRAGGRCAGLRARLRHGRLSAPFPRLRRTRRSALHPRHLSTQAHLDIWSPVGAQACCVPLKGATSIRQGYGMAAKSRPYVWLRRNRSVPSAQSAVQFRSVLTADNSDSRRFQDIENRMPINHRHRLDARLRRLGSLRFLL
jgi:hypothetical protein